MPSTANKLVLFLRVVSFDKPNFDRRESRIEGGKAGRKGKEQLRQGRKATWERAQREENLGFVCSVCAERETNGSCTFGARAARKFF